MGKYRCLLCQKEFSSESGVKYHIIKAHSEVRKRLGMVQAGPRSNTPVLTLSRSIHPCLPRAEHSSSQQHQQHCDSLGDTSLSPFWSLTPLGWLKLLSAGQLILGEAMPVGRGVVQAWADEAWAVRAGGQPQDGH